MTTNNDTPTQKNYLLAILTAVLVINYADRLVFGVVLEDIKSDLALTDTQLGFLSGIAFAFFYAIMGVPIARWADRGNRVTIISLCTLVWSAAVALCGAAANFMQLMLMRMGVAVGEAGCYAPSLSLISDHFPRAERARAVSRFWLGIPIAAIVGYLAAGWCNELYGWRVTFLLFGLPGLLLGPLAWLTLKEPRRLALSKASRAQSAATAASTAAPGLGEVATKLWSNAAFRHLFFMFSVWGFFAQGIMQWQPAFFVRTHGVSTGELGTWFAVLQGAGGLLGTYLGGEWATRYASNNERLQMQAMGVAYALLAFLTAAAYITPDAQVAFVLLGVSAVIGGAFNGPLFATIQSLVPARMRALAVASMYFFCNLIGLGLGPLAVGMLSDGLNPAFGDDSLRYALLAFCPGYIWSAWHLWQAGRTVNRDIAVTEADNSAHELESRQAT